MQTPTRLITGALLCLAASGSFGLGFGRTTLTSSLGQPLGFALTVRLQSGEDLQPECIKADVVSGDSHLPAINVRTALRGQTGEVTERALVITTTSVIDEPIVTITVTIGCPPSLTRSFVAFVDPPVLNLARSDVAVSPTSRADASTQPSPPREPAPRAARPRLARPPPTIASRPPAPASDAAASSEAVAAPAPPRPRAKATPPSTPASAPAPSARSSDPVTARNAPSATPNRGARLQLESSRLEARPVGAPVATAGIAAAARAVASAPSGSPALSAASRPTSASASTPASIAATPAATPVPPSTPTTAAAGAGSGAGVPASAAAFGAAAGASSASAGAGAGAGAAAGVVAAAAAPVTPADAERQRLQSVEDTLTKLRNDSAANQRTLMAIQAQLREAEADRYANPVVYILALICLILALGLAWLARQRGRDRSEMAWWATPEGEAMRAAATQIMTTGHGGLSERNTSPSSFQSTTLPPRTLSPPITEMTLPHVTAPAALGAVSMSGPTSTSMRSPVPTPEVPRREMTVDELMDLEQQVEFFVVLGQDESAIDLLLGHLRGSGATNPLPYLKLLDIYLSRGERDAYERIRERFNQQFNAVVPPFGSNPADGKSLEDYGPLMSRLQFLWSDPSQALEVLQSAIFSRGEAAVRFDLPAYRELLFLYALARDMASREATGNVDVLLPFGDDDFVDSVSPMLNTMQVIPNPVAQRPLEVDFDVSRPGAFDSSVRDDPFENSGFGSGFGALPDDKAKTPRKPR